MRKILIMTMLTGVLLTNLVFAENTPLLISSNPTTVEEKTMNSVMVNGAKLDKEAIVDEAGITLYPLKGVAEGLGYQVAWQPETRMVELIKGARYITLKTTENYFTFSKMAPEKLETKATIKNGSTYVPASFFDKFLDAGVITENHTIEVFSPYEDETRTSHLVIREFVDGRIVVDHFEGEGVVILSEETVITDRETGAQIKLEDLKIGDTLKVTHPSVMILIYPPQYPAIEIERINSVDYNEGAITEIGEDWLLVKTTLMDIRFNIDQVTTLKNNSDQEVEFNNLRVGNKIKIYHSKAMTRSLPPQTLAYEIIVDTQVK